MGIPFLENPKEWSRFSKSMAFSWFLKGNIVTRLWVFVVIAKRAILRERPLSKRQSQSKMRPRDPESQD